MSVLEMTTAKNRVDFKKYIINMNNLTRKELIIREHLFNSVFKEVSRELGATDFNSAMRGAAWRCHVEIVKLCKKWGATEFYEAMRGPAWGGDVEIVKLCKEW